MQQLNQGAQGMQEISFKLNGNPVTRTLDGQRLLLWVLRTDFGLTGTKYGCGENWCGACTVLINNQAVRSCQTYVGQVQGQEVTTIEGLTVKGRLHPLQQAFIDHDALQCGFCTPGMILNAYALLHNNPKPSQEQIIEGMNDNLCRCGAHKRIVQAILDAGRQMQGGES